MTKQRIHPFEAILSQDVMTISEWGIIEPINDDQRGTLERAISTLLTSRPPRSPLLLYRGDSKTQLRKQLFACGITDQPDGILYSRLFYFGAKARHFYMDPDEEIIRRRPLRSISDIAPKTFQWLFAEVARVLRYRHKQVIAFRESNKAFTEYFGNSENLGEFTRQAKSLVPWKRQLVRDYYLFFLHTFGRRGIHRQTMLVSTSRSIEQASRFCSHGRDNVLLYLFQSPAWSRFAISQAPGRYKAILREIGAPTYMDGRGLYPEQQEVGVRGAIFPQRLLGVRDKSKKYFLVNPHLFNMPSSDIADLTRSGIRLDQAGFEQLARETGFFRHVALRRNRWYQGLSHR
jgi:hypothetical protein